MATVTDLIKYALRNIKVLAPTETPTDTELADGLVTLNNMIDAWNAERYYVYCLNNLSHTLTPNSASFTIGPSGNLVADRPLRIESAQIEDAQGVSFPINLITDPEEYFKIAFKSALSRPIKLFYNPTGDAGTVYLWPIPDAAYTIKLQVWHPLTQFATINDEIELPPGYFQALQYNLALLLADEYGVEPTATLVALATRSKERIKVVNMQSAIPILTPDFPSAYAGSTHFNIISGN